MHVASASGDNVLYEVKLRTEIPSCTCFDWKKTGFPCKHIAAAVAHTGIEWTDLPTSFTAHPMFTPDHTVLYSVATTRPSNVSAQEETMQVSMHTPMHTPSEAEASTAPEGPTLDASHVLDAMDKEDQHRRRLLALEKAQRVWREIERLLYLNDSCDVAEGLLTRLTEAQEFLESSVQGGKRLKELLRQDLGREPIKKSSISAKVAKSRGRYQKKAAQFRALERLRQTTIKSSAGVRKRVVPMDDRAAKKHRVRLAKLAKMAKAADKKAKKEEEAASRPIILQLDDQKYSYNPLAVPVVELDPELRDTPGTFVTGMENRQLQKSSSRGICKFSMQYVILFGPGSALS